MSDEEMTVQQRAGLVLNACTETQLNDEQSRQLSEVLYTLSEAGEISDEVYKEKALLIYSLINMIKSGAFTEDMRL